MITTVIDAGSLADVGIRSAEGRWTLILCRDLRHSPTKVWAALTDPDQLAQWAPFLASRDLAAIGDVTLTMVDGKVRQDLAATVTASEPPTLLEYTWGQDLLRWELVAIPVDAEPSAVPSTKPGAGDSMGEGEASSEHALESANGGRTDSAPQPSDNTDRTGSATHGNTATGATGTRLILRHTVAGRDGIPKAAAGWHLCLLVAERLLNGGPVGPIRGRDALNHGWSELNEAYAAQLGIPATDLPEDPIQQ